MMNSDLENIINQNKEIILIAERCCEQTNDMLIVLEHLRTIIDSLTKRVGILEREVELRK